MHIVIIGGSNSAIRDRYVKSFQDHFTRLVGEVTITNLAAGGTTSLSSIGLVADIEAPIDLIVFEYSLNDAGHLNHRKDGKEKKTLFLEMVFSHLAQIHPEARILPLILASQEFYSLAVPNAVYTAEVDYYESLGINYVDMRRYFPEIFGEPPPNFIYADKAHYHRGIASTVIGKLLAENARWSMFSQRPLGEIVKKTFVLSNGQRAAHRYYSASDIADAAKIGPSVLNVENSHLKLNCLQIKFGDSIAIPSRGIPAAIYIASDTSHSRLCIETNRIKTIFSTKYEGIAEGKFVYTSVPLLLSDRSELNLETPNEGTTLSFERFQHSDFDFDCFERAPVPKGMARARIVGISMLEAV